MSDAPELPALPAHDRITLRVLVGTLRMLEAELREMSHGLRTHPGLLLPAADAVQAAWQAAHTLFMTTRDAPESVTSDRPKTMGSDDVGTV